MSPRKLPLVRSERGSVLLVTMVFLLIFGVIAASIFRSSQTSVQAIGNMQWRTQAIDAANLYIARILSTPTDINNALTLDLFPADSIIDGITVSTDDFDCTFTQRLETENIDPDNSDELACLNSELVLGGSFCERVNFSLVVTASDPTTGANVRIEQGGSVIAVGPAVCNN